jgi:hypothetical protein
VRPVQRGPPAQPVLLARVGSAAGSNLTAAKGIGPNVFDSWQVNCPGAKKALGGGMALEQENALVRIVESAPAGAATGWLVSVWNQSTTGVTACAWVICANVAS